MNKKNINPQETVAPVFNVTQAEHLRLRDFPEHYPVVASALLGAFQNRRTLREYVLEIACLHPVTIYSDHADELADALNEGWEGEWDIHSRHQLSTEEVTTWRELFFEES
jgi:hypothetical protein